jgi:hypothetical protein
VILATQKKTAILTDGGFILPITKNLKLFTTRSALPLGSAKNLKQFAGVATPESL